MTPKERLEFCRVQISGWVQEIAKESDPKRIEEILPNLIFWWQEKQKQEAILFPQPIFMPGNPVPWTAKRYAELKFAYMKAMQSKAESFTLSFLPGPLLTLYARYLIEYLKERFPHV